MVVLDSLTGVGWILFWLYWIISAVGSKKNITSYSYTRNFIFVRIGIVLLAFVLLRLSGSNNHILKNIHLVQNSQTLSIIGFILFISGLLLAIWARLHLGKNWGMPMSLKQDPELVTSGPYSFIRHPIYSGILLALFGSALVISLYWLVILVVVGVYFIYSAIKEEKIMSNQFPKTYASYKQKTKMLVPFIL